MQEATTPWAPPAENEKKKKLSDLWLLPQADSATTIPIVTDKSKLLSSREKSLLQTKIGELQTTISEIEIINVRLNVTAISLGGNAVESPQMDQVRDLQFFYGQKLDFLREKLAGLQEKLTNGSSKY